MPRTQHSFSKVVRLTGKKSIKELFDSGSSFYVHPFKVTYKVQAEPMEFDRVMVTVPKRIFKKVVTRNKIRRRIKEAYRLNRHLLLKGQTINFNIAYIYVAKESLPYKLIERKLIESLNRLQDIKQQLNKNEK